LFLLIPSKKLFSTKILVLKLDGTAASEDVKLVSFPWPSVMATHDRKRLARALHAGSNL
jgi:hypothetical protein